MSLVDCMKCGASISSSAVLCPECGTDTPHLPLEGIESIEERSLPALLGNAVGRLGRGAVRVLTGLIGALAGAYGGPFVVIGVVQIVGLTLSLAKSIIPAADVLWSMVTNVDLSFEYPSAVGALCGFILGFWEGRRLE